MLLLLTKPQFSFDHTSNMPLSQEKKEAYFIKLEGYLNEYKKIFLVNVDNVGSRQMQLIRAGLRGHAEILMGKNTMIRKIIAGFLAKNGEDHPISKLTPLMRQNVGFVFTNGSLADIRQMIQENRVPAPARVGAIAPVDVYCPAGGTGCDPGQTAFFQALNIGTKINKGSIEIINDCKVIIEGQKVRGRTLTARAPMAHTKRPPNCGFQIRARGSTPPPPRTAVKAATACVTQDHSCCAMALATCAHAMHLGAPHISRLPHILE